MTVKQTLFKAGLLLLGVLALQRAAHAQGLPEITPSLKKMFGALQIDGVKDELHSMLGALKKTSCGGGLTGCYGTQTPDGKLQLYFFTSKQSQQTLVAVINQQVSMPKSALPEKLQKSLGGTQFGTPIISISTTSFDLVTANMPPALQQVMKDHYYNVSSMNFEAGVQMAASVKLGGAVALAMKKVGVTGLDKVTMRTALVIPIPTDLAGGAGAGIGIANAMQHGDTFKKAGADALKPEAYVELQLAPGTVVDFKASAMRLSDATFFLNNSLVFGFKGNGVFKGAENRKMIVQYQGPLIPEDGLDLLDFQLLMATPPKFTMEDQMRIMYAVATQPPPGTGSKVNNYINSLKAYLDPMMVAAKPLSAFQVNNPLLTVDYEYGNPNKPFPRDDQFNLVILGPLAEGGPYLRTTGDLRVLGQKMGWLDANAGINGLYGVAGAGIDIKLGPLGHLPIKMQATIDVDKGKQIIRLTGNVDGQKILVTFGSKIGIEVNASCVNPFEIKASVELTPDADIAKIFDAQGGVNVDPSGIMGCAGKDLEAAYRKVAGEFKSLGGYTANAANAELKKISDAAEKVAKQAQEEAQRDYNRVKDGARDTANKATNSAANAFKDAGNAFKKIGKKKKHKKGPDPIFAASVFDWDYYYDNAPDVVKAKVDLSTHWKDNGFNEGRQGSREFSAVFYRNRYLDVQQLCGQGDWRCVVQHWLDMGIQQGRQGSASFSIASYLKRYPDLQSAFGRTNYEDALDHWFNSGEDEGRDPRPDATSPTQISGPASVGGSGGSAWNDADICGDQPVIGFRIRTGKRVDGVQFLYPSGWGPAHGNLGRAPYTFEIVLPAGQSFAVVHSRSGESLDALGLISNVGTGYGMFGGGGGTFRVYNVTPGEKLGCMAGRSGGEIDQLIFSSTGPR